MITVKVMAVLATLPCVAVIREVPAPVPTAKPVLVPIVATEAVAEVHVTFVVMFCVLSSLYVPVAVNCSVVPFTMEGFVGVTAMDCRVGAVTVRVIPGLTMVPCVAVICEVPTPAPLARPVPVPIVATEAVAEAQVTLVVMFCVLPSL